MTTSSPSLFKISIFIFTMFASQIALAWNTPTIRALGNKYTKYTWTGNDFANNLNWNNPANWCGSYIDGACRGAATAPTTTDIVVFNDVCGAHCNANLTANVTVEAVLITSDYTGTINQGTFDFTANGTFGNAWNQSGGTFQMGSGNFTASGSRFILAGGSFIGSSGGITIGSGVNADYAVFSGGSFTASSTVTTVRCTADFRGLSSFTHNSGLFQFTTGGAPTNGHWFTGNSMIFNNVKLFAPSGTTVSMNATTLVMDGDLQLFGSGVTTVQYNTGTVELRQGNVIRGGAAFIGTLVTKFTGTGLQTIDMTGTTVAQYPGIWTAQTAVTGSFKVIGTSITMFGGFLTTGNLGTIDHNSVAYGFYSINVSPLGNWYDTQGYVTFPNLTIGGNTIRLGFGTVKAVDLVVDGNGSPNYGNPSGVVEVTGNVSFTAGGIWQSHVKLLINGTGAQVINCTGSTGCVLPYVEVNKLGGTLSFVGTPGFNYGFNYIAGGFTVPTSAYFSIGSGATSTYFTSNGIIWNNVMIGGTYGSTHSITFNDTLKVSGNLQFANNSGLKTLYGTIEVSGDITCATQGFGVRWTAASAGVIKTVGVNQAINMSLCNATPAGGGTVLMPILQIASSGTVTSTSTFVVANYIHNSGAVNLVGSTVYFNIGSGYTVTPGPTEFGTVIVNGANFTLSGTAKVNSELRLNSTGGSQTITGGTFEVYGDLVSNNNGHGGTVAITLKGNDSTFSRTSTAFPTGTFTVAKNATKKVTLTTNITMNNNQSINVTGGDIDIGSAARTLTLSGTGNVTLAAATKVILSGGTLMIGGSSIPAGPYSGGAIDP